MGGALKRLKRNQQPIYEDGSRYPDMEMLRGGHVTLEKALEKALERALRALRALPYARARPRAVSELG